VVKKAEQQILARELAGAENKEYLGMDGLPAFNKLTAQLLFGADAPAIKEGRVATIQGLSVRAGLRVRLRAREQPGSVAARAARARRMLTPHLLPPPFARADTRCAGRRARARCAWAPPSSPSSCRAGCVARAQPGTRNNPQADTPRDRMCVSVHAQVAYISEPTWGNHKNIFGDERVEWRTYRYFDPKTVGLDFEGALRWRACRVRHAPQTSPN
jgi:hypothetical protein